MGKRERDSAVNYAFSIGFIILIVVFLTSILAISRFVFLDETPIKEHLIDTKELLEKASEVEKTTEELKNSSKDDSPKVKGNTNLDAFNITAINYINNPKGKSFVTLTFVGHAESFDNHYYNRNFNRSNLEEEDLIVYISDTFHIGTFVSHVDESTVRILERKTNEIKDFNINVIEGKVFFIAND